MTTKGLRCVPHCAIVCVVLWLGACSSAPAKRVQLLRIGTSGDYPPFSEATARPAGYRGFDVDVARAFAAAQGREIRWVAFRWPDLARDLQAGRFDLAMSGVTVRADRSVRGRFSVPVAVSGAVLLYRRARFEAGLGDGFLRFDREGVRVAVNRGGHLERVARARFAHASLQSFPDNAAVRRALADGRVDVVVTDTIEAPLWRAGLPEIGQFGPLTRDRKAYWVAADRGALARSLDGWLLAREADGTLARLRRRWLGAASGETSAEPARALVAAIDERLALMPWVAESKRASGRAVEDRAREERVLAAAARSVARAACEARRPAPLARNVRAFYRVQIEAAKEIQRRTLAEPAHRPARAEDLDGLLRPALIRIGERMARLIVAAQHTRAPPISLADELAPYELGDERIVELTRAFVAVVSGGVEGEIEDCATVDASR